MPHPFPNETQKQRILGGCKTPALVYLQASAITRAVGLAETNPYMVEFAEVVVIGVDVNVEMRAVFSGVNLTKAIAMQS